ncbi:MAG: hypothetical protein AB1898_30650 [Acidobacteriota bacterium]
MRAHWPIVILLLAGCLLTGLAYGDLLIVFKNPSRVMDCIVATIIIAIPLGWLIEYFRD